jgi:ATP-dependent Clp protease ATP-binding subunit ClpC
LFERFTDRARRVVVLAQQEARLLNHNYIGTEHILLGLIHEGEGVACRALESLSVSLEAVRQKVEEIIGQGEDTAAGHIPFTPRAKKVLELSLREALQLGHNYIGTEHILLGLVREGEGVAAQVLVKLGAGLERVREEVISLLSGFAETTSPEDRPAGAEVEETPPWRRLRPGRASAGVPACPECKSSLEEHAAFRTVSLAAGEDERRTVDVIFCQKCGTTLGVVGPGARGEWT